MFKNELITYDEALRWASNVDEFKLKVQGISTTADASRDQMANTIFSKAPGAKPAAAGKPAPAPPKTPEITRFGG